jgi:hypothetical protein
VEPVGFRHHLVGVIGRRTGALLALSLGLFATHCGGRSSRVLGFGPGVPEGGAAGEPGISIGGESGAGNRGGSGGVSAAGGSAAGGFNGCMGQRLDALEASIEFLVDSSGSLREPWVDDTTRWEFVQGALASAFSSYREPTAAGLVFYPNVQWSAGVQGEGDDFCLLTYESAPIAAMSEQHRESLREAIEGQPTLGATPTYDAYEYAVSLLSAQMSGRARALVLLTDGAPTYSEGCDGDGVTPVDSSPLADAARRALTEHAIRTFVIGVSGEVQGLSAMAEAGNSARYGCDSAAEVPCHFDASGSSSPGAFLDRALASIEQETSRCAFEAPLLSEGEPLDLSTVQLALSMPGVTAVVSYVPDDEPCVRGFRYIASERQYLLCGSVCSEYASQAGLSVELRVGCARTGGPPP